MDKLMKRERQEEDNKREICEKRKLDNEQEIERNVKGKAK